MESPDSQGLGSLRIHRVLRGSSSRNASTQICFRSLSWRFRGSWVPTSLASRSFVTVARRRRGSPIRPGSRPARYECRECAIRFEDDASGTLLEVED